MYIPQKPTWSSVELAPWQYSRSKKDMDSFHCLSWCQLHQYPERAITALQGVISHRLWNFCCAYTWPTSSSLIKLCSSLGVSICVHLGDFYHKETYLSPFLLKSCSKVGEMKSALSLSLQRNVQPWLCDVGRLKMGEQLKLAELV